MRSFRATHNIIAVSANKRESAVNTEQTLDTSLLVDLGDVISLERRRETNENELTGKEEPDRVYSLGATSSANFNFNKAQPQHFAFLLSYALGSCVSTASGAGYEHLITPIQGDVDLNRSLPSFSAMQRFGKQVFKRRFASLFVDSVTATFNADDWVKVSGSIKGTGKFEDNVLEEEVVASDGGGSLTLSKQVEGEDDQTRLDNVHQIRAEISPGTWVEVEFSAVSGDNPAVVTITPPTPGGTTNITYRVIYIPKEDTKWVFPVRVQETPLRVSELQVVVGGKWDGSVFQGGRALTGEVRSIEWSLNNNLQIEFRPGATGAYATSAFRDGRQQKLSLNREMREYILQNFMNTDELFGVYLKAYGDEFAPGENYQVEIIFPKVGVLNSPISVDGKRLAEAGDLQVLEDDVFGSVVVRVKNQVSAYAAK